MIGFINKVRLYVINKINFAKRIEAKIQSTKPIADFNDRFSAIEDRIIKKLGEDSDAVKIIRAYKKFADKHTVVQWLIIDALEFGLAFSAGGVLGAMAIYASITALDGILKGEKLSAVLVRSAGSAASDLIKIP